MNSLSITWEKPIESDQVTLDRSSLSLDVGDTYQLVATVTPSWAGNKEVTWTSSNSNIASVSDGLVTAKNSGSATITATTVLGNHEASCVVNVSKSESGSGKVSITFSDIYSENVTTPNVNFYTDSENENQTIDVAFEQGQSSYNPYYATNGSAVRVYAKNTFTVTSSKQNLISIDFVLSTTSATEPNTITASVGTYTDVGPQTATEGNWVSGTSMVNAVTFTVGGSTGQRRVVSMTITYYDSFAFAKDLLNNTVCDDSGVNPPSVDWTDLSNKAAVLFDSEKTYLKKAEANELGNKVEQAVARYDYVVGKYGTDSYTDFLLRDPDPISHSAFTISENNESSVLIILLIATSSLSTLVLLIVKKRKRHNK